MAQSDEFLSDDSSQQAEETEQRRQERHVCRKNNLIKLVIRPEFRTCQGLIHDVSSRGLGFFLNRPLEVGTTIALQLRGSRPGISCTRMARVMHVRSHRSPRNPPWQEKKKHFLSGFFMLFGLEAESSSENARNVYLIGCQLSPPLSEDEIEELM